MPSWRRTRRAATLVCALLLLLANPVAEEKRLAVYAPRVNYSVPVLEREGGDYVGLVELLEPLCGVSAWLDGKNWMLRCDKVAAEFKVGNNTGKVRDHRVDLPARFLVENDRGLVPMRVLPSLLPLFLGQPAELHEAGRRLFLGDTAVRFTPELRKDALVVSFSGAVNPSISTEPGKLKMTFNREPVVAGINQVRYDSPLVSSLSFAETNGRAELTVTSHVPLLASFSDQGKTITITAAPGAPAAGAESTAAASPATAEQAPGAATPTPQPLLPQPPPRPQYVVLVDASHGGDERGAQLSARLAEKDVTLALARKLRYELQQRGVSTLMSRDSDITLATEQRATLANISRAILYISIHAGTLGHGVRLYTAMMPTISSQPGAFLPWDTAQSRFLDSSRGVAQQVSAELQKREVPAPVLAGPVRPLSNITAPAFALELTPAKNDADSLNSYSYQQSVAAAVATAIAAARPRLEAAR